MEPRRRIVARGLSEPVRVGGSGRTGTGRASEQQLFLGNVPMFKQTVTIVYLQELIRRGLDPRSR